MSKGLSLFDKRRRRNRTALRSRGGGRPRLSVHRSGKHIYAQVIDDKEGRTLAAASTLYKDVRGSTGATVAKRASATIESMPRRRVIAGLPATPECVRPGDG